MCADQKFKLAQSQQTHSNFRPEPNKEVWNHFHPNDFPGSREIKPLVGAPGANADRFLSRVSLISSIRRPPIDISRLVALSVQDGTPWIQTRQDLLRGFRS